MLSSRQLEAARADYRTRRGFYQQAAEPITQRGVWLSTESRLSRVTDEVMKKKVSRRRIDVNVEELDRIIDDGKSAPLCESDSEKLKSALHALAERLLPRSKT